MQQLLKWTLDAIREDGSMMSWMEENRFEWVPLAASALENIISGHTIIILTDKEREWFGSYILSSINKPGKNRPLLPFMSFGAIFADTENIKNDEDMQLLEDMLSLSFPGGYNFFYIGKSDDKRAEIAKRKDNSFLWIMDEHFQNSFYFNSNDELLDMKLIQLMRLFDKSIDAALFAEIDVKE